MEVTVEDDKLGWGWLVSYKYYIRENGRTISDGFGEYYAHTSHSNFNRNSIEVVRESILNHNIVDNTKPREFRFTIISISNLGQMKKEEILT